MSELADLMTIEQLQSQLKTVKLGLEEVRRMVLDIQSRVGGGPVRLSPGDAGAMRAVPHEGKVV